MNVFAVYSVNEHLADLLLQAEAERLARLATNDWDDRPKRDSRLTSWVHRVRVALTPPVPLSGYPSRA
jgi:hypothetical protein